MVTVMQTAGLTLTALLITKLLERHTKEQALLISLLLCFLLTSAAVISLTPVLTRMDSLLSSSGLSPEAAGSIGKAIGICCVTGLAADVCKDAGESALSSTVLLTGKAALLLLALPLIDPLLDLVREVLLCAG